MTSDKSSIEKSRQNDQNSSEDLKEFIKKKKIQNEALKKIIDKLNSSEQTTNK